MSTEMLFTTEPALVEPCDSEAGRVGRIVYSPIDIGEAATRVRLVLDVVELAPIEGSSEPPFVDVDVESAPALEGPWTVRGKFPRQVERSVAPYSANTDRFVRIAASFHARTARFAVGGNAR